MRLHHPSHRQLESGCTARLASCDGASTITYAANASGLTQTAACLSTRRCEVTRFRHDAGCWLFRGTNRSSDGGTKRRTGTCTDTCTDKHRQAGVVRSPMRGTGAAEAGCSLLLKAGSDTICPAATSSLHISKKKIIASQLTMS